MIHKQRIRNLNDRSIGNGRYVLYWMQASQRVEYNHALEYAIRQASRMALPVVVLFVLTEHFPEANFRHYVFMLEGLKEVSLSLKARNIAFVFRCGSPEKDVLDLAKAAAMVIVDRGYLRIQKAWRRHIAENARCCVVEVESDVVVPVETALEKESWSAAVLRPRIKKLLPEYLAFLKKTPVRRSTAKLDLHDLSEKSEMTDLAHTLPIDLTVTPVATFKGGTGEAVKHLKHFIEYNLKSYPDHHNNPSVSGTSNLSPYLHFGQISPLYIALKIRDAADIPETAKETFLEELIVRRELSMNFVHYNEKYDSFAGLSEWSKRTLQKHVSDKRPYLYSLKEFEEARTHDPYWNAAQMEVVKTGKMRNYMRMYWGKKIIEWTAHPEEAYEVALYLNNRYELDGRDPNSFAGVAWCFGKHDRPWAERNIFGNIRYMNASGLQRKFKIDQYVKKIDLL